VTLDWRAVTPCRTYDADEWFVNNPSLAWAQRLCRGCPILKPCAEYALQLDVHGIWGGTTAQYRRAKQRAQGIIPTPIVPGGEPRPRAAPKSLALWAASEPLMQAGASLADAAQQLGVSHGLLKDARIRARRHLAEAGRSPAPSST